MTTPPRPRRSLLQRLARRLTTSSRPDPTRPPSVTKRAWSPCEPSGTRLAISIVDDPHGAIRLIGAQGTIDGLTVGRLIDVLDELGDGLSLHLDLGRARIGDAPTLRRLEAMIDELERRGVQMRIVGVDPEHPALVEPGNG